MAVNPAFAATPQHGMGVLSAANTNRDGTGTIVTVLTAGSSGSVVERIVIVATGVTTAGVVRLYIHDGTTARLWKEVLVSAITPSTSVEVFRESLNLSGAASDGEPPIRMQQGYSLRASTHNAEGFIVHAEGGSL